MVNDVLTAVTTQLGTTFGNNYHYYVEDISQDLKKPCFTIDMVLPMQRSRSPVLYDRTMPIVVHYFTNNQDSLKRECYRKAEEIIECLEYLPFKGGLIRAENISWEITEGVLQIFMTYRFRTRKVTVDETNMEILEDNNLITK